MKMNVILISSDHKMRALVEGIVSRTDFGVMTFPDIGSAIDWALSEQHSLLLLDLDSVNVDQQTLKGMSPLLVSSQLIGISAHNYHPYLKEAVQSGLFTALVKPPFDEELTYWIKSLRVTGDSFQAI